MLPDRRTSACVLYDVQSDAMHIHAEIERTSAERAGHGSSARRTRGVVLAVRTLVEAESGLL